MGAKRNLTILLASGQYIVNFDEDDLYADRYVERMGTVMQQRILVAVTLSGWHNFFEARGPAGYSEPNSWDPEDEDEMDEILYHIEFHPFHPRLLDYGYGFSYVHLRVMALFYPYLNLAFAEDAPFMLKLRQKMGRSHLLTQFQHKRSFAKAKFGYDNVTATKFRHNFFEARGCAGYSEPKSLDPEDQNENFNRIFWMEILYSYGFSHVDLAGDGLVLSLSKQGGGRCAFHAETPGRC